MPKSKTTAAPDLATPRALDSIRECMMNPRVIPDAAVAAVANSILHYSWQQPIVVEEDGTIVVGHTRFRAAKMLLARTDAIIPRWPDKSVVPVKIFGGTKDEARAYRIADNRVGEFSEFDLPRLRAEIAELSSAGVDLAPLGFGDGIVELLPVETVEGAGEGVSSDTTAGGTGKRQIEGNFTLPYAVNDGGLNPCSYYGGKDGMLGFLKPLLDGIEHSFYGEGFFGGGSVFIAKDLVKSNAVNDALDGVIALWTAVAEKPEEFRAELDKWALHSEALHRKATDIVKGIAPRESELQFAAAVWYSLNTSLEASLGAGISHHSDRDVAGRLITRMNALLSPAVVAKLQAAQICRRDVLEFLEIFDKNRRGLFFLDPPYAEGHASGRETNMGHYSGYGTANYQRLLDRIGGKKMKSMFVLTCYDGPMVRAATEKYGWKFAVLDIPNTAGQRGRADGKAPRKREFIASNCGDLK